MNNQKLIETVKQMHEHMGQDDTLDLGGGEMCHFYAEAKNGQIVDALYDCYLLGVYRGLHGADQEG